MVKYKIKLNKTSVNKALKQTLKTALLNAYKIQIIVIMYHYSKKN